MRILLRIMFGLMLVVGVLLAIIYPWSAATVGEYEIGRHVLFDGEEWKPAQQLLEATEVPVSVAVSMTVAQEFPTQADRPVLTVTAAEGERTVLSSALSFADAPPSKASPQAREAIYRAEAGRIEDATDDLFVFEARPAGGAEGIAFEKVEIVLRAGAFELDARAGPAGFGLIALAIAGLVASLRRFTPSRTRNPNEKPPSQWGRR